VLKVKKYKAVFWSLYSQLAKNEKGEVNIGGIILLGLAMVFISVGFIMLPIATGACSDILSYVYSGNATITDASYTGLTSITGITPLLILLGFLTEAVISGFLGIKVMKGSGGGKVTPGNLILLGLSIVFIAVGLIMFPVALDGISSVYSNEGAGLNTAFTGFQSLLLISPMLIELGYIVASVITGFFGIKSLNQG
jgi:hypothetical protein